MKKRIVIAALCVCMALVFCVPASLAAGDYPTPWEREDMYIDVLEDFYWAEDRYINAREELRWEAAPDFPYTARFLNRQLVFNYSRGTSADFRYMFPVRETYLYNFNLFQGMEGLGFYMENNTDKAQSIGLFMIGNGLFVLDYNSTVILYSIDGKYTVLHGDGSVNVPAGFKGYYVVPLEFIVNDWNNHSAWDPKTDFLLSFGLRFASVSIDSIKGETLVFDDLFIYGRNVQNNRGEVIVFMNAGPAQTPPSEEQPAGSPVAQPSETTQKPPEGYAPAWALWLMAGIGALGIIVISVIFTVMINKKRN